MVKKQNLLLATENEQQKKCWNSKKRAKRPYFHCGPLDSKTLKRDGKKQKDISKVKKICLS